MINLPTACHEAKVLGKVSFTLFSTVLENSNINVNEIEHTYFRLPNVHESTNTE